MQNHIQSGDTLELTAPVGGVVSGTAYKIGQLLVVAVADADAGDKFSGKTTGVYDLPKATGQAWTEGALLYWDNTNHRFTTTATGNLLAACAAAAAASGDTEGRVRLNGVVRANEA